MKYIFLRLTAVAICFIFTEPQRPKFREDYRYEKAFNTFYKLHTAATDWWRARMRCEAEGAELMIPETLDEADTVSLLVATVQSNFVGIYVGMHDLFAERYFVTVNGSETENTILDMLWEYDQPAHSGGRCVAVRRTGRFFVHPCAESLPFLCRVKADQITYYPECNTYDPNWKLGPNDTCYITHVEPQPWHEAYSTCVAAGGHLAVLGSRDEAEYIRDIFKHVDQNKTPGDFAFLGYSDLFQRYHYRTIHGERINNGIDWDFKCPATNSSAQKEMRCGGFRRSGLLATGDCAQPAMFFCEKMANVTSKPNIRTSSHPHRRI